MQMGAFCVLRSLQDIDLNLKALNILVKQERVLVYLTPWLLTSFPSVIMKYNYNRIEQIIMFYFQYIMIKFVCFSPLCTFMLGDQDAPTIFALYNTHFLLRYHDS